MRGGLGGGVDLAGEVGEGLRGVEFEDGRREGEVAGGEGVVAGAGGGEGEVGVEKGEVDVLEGGAAGAGDEDGAELREGFERGGGVLFEGDDGVGEGDDGEGPFGDFEGEGALEVLAGLGGAAEVDGEEEGGGDPGGVAGGGGLRGLQVGEGGFEVGSGFVEEGEGGVVDVVGDG